MTKEEIVYAAIRQIANTDKPERFAEINQTTFKVAMKVAELMQPSLPEGLDVTDFCKPIQKEIAEKMPEVTDECIWGKKCPEGLDEAAEELANEHGFVKHPSCKPAKYSYQAVRDVFIEAAIAGAEWMAGQGVTCGGRIMKSSTGETYAESDYVPLDGKCGDKVIVQIRKTGKCKSV